MTKIICIRQTWSHMASVSGFDVLAESLSRLPNVELASIRNVQAKCSKKRDLAWYMRKLGLTKSSQRPNRLPITPFWNPVNSDLTRRALAELEASPADALVLLMALEDQFDAELVGIDAQSKRQIIVVAHQPPAWYRLNWRDFSALDGLGGIICLSQSQQDFFAIVTNAPLIQLKHGVRSDFFSPQASLKTEVDKRLLFVGQWLRDLDVLERAMHYIWKQQPETKLDCVIPRSSRSHPALYRLARDHRVVWHAVLDAEALRGLYRRATLLFLPLLDSTANNAIIEALASGLPIVSTRVGGVDEYVRSECGELCTVGDELAHADAVMRWLDDAGRRTKAGVFARNFAVENLDWGRISVGLLNQLV
ncbi:MAG: glycosyltransferase family 4 protein [Desulfobulbaceae bacterium]|nr:glycosyltransferase family 4 protein [Desulfobulbaceae bacterium]